MRPARDVSDHGNHLMHRCALLLLSIVSASVASASTGWWRIPATDCVDKEGSTIKTVEGDVPTMQDPNHSD